MTRNDEDTAIDGFDCIVQPNMSSVALDSQISCSTISPMSSPSKGRMRTVGSCKRSCCSRRTKQVWKPTRNRTRKKHMIVWYCEQPLETYSIFYLFWYPGVTSSLNKHVFCQPGFRVHSPWKALLGLWIRITWAMYFNPYDCSWGVLFTRWWKLS